MQSEPVAVELLYRLRREHGCWSLVFDGRPALLRHEAGIAPVAWLLAHPGEPIHGLDLAGRAGRAGAADPESAVTAPESLGPREKAFLLLRRKRELYLLIESEEECEAVRNEARDELEALCRVHAGHVADQAERAVRSVRRAIRRFHLRLAAATDSAGAPHPVLRPFADHLRRCLLVPTSRYAGPGARNARARQGLAGRFLYDPPPGLRWKCE